MSTGSPATTPATLPLLEFASLPQRHPGPIGMSLLSQLAPHAAVRLAEVTGDTSREVSVLWRPRDGRRNEQTERRVLDWSGCSIAWGNSPETIVAALSDQDRTEYAAIAVMALLVHDLEGGEVVETLAIGSGADYDVLVKKARVRIEVSGVGEDAKGYKTTRRVTKKSSQVLGHSKKGFVSVTTFGYKAQGVYSQLLHVRK